MIRPFTGAPRRFPKAITQFTLILLLRINFGIENLSLAIIIMATSIQAGIIHQIIMIGFKLPVRTIHLAWDSEMGKKGDFFRVVTKGCALNLTTSTQVNPDCYGGTGSACVSTSGQSALSSSLTYAVE